MEFLLIPSVSQSVHLGGLSVALLIGSHQLPIRLDLLLCHRLEVFDLAYPLLLHLIFEGVKLPLQGLLLSIGLLELVPYGLEPAFLVQCLPLQLGDFLGQAEFGLRGNLLVVLLYLHLRVLRLIRLLL